ncbi:MAG: nuclear transport factor 2 family protein [Bacteroidota bacterium]
MTVVNQQLYKDISEAFVKGNIPFFIPYLSDEIKWHILGYKTIIGRENVLELYTMSELESFPISTIKNMIAEAGYVVVESTGEARAKNGKVYNQKYCDIFRFKGEKLEEITTYLDTALSKEAFNNS